MVLGSNLVAVSQISDIAPVSSKEFLDIQATIECRFSLKCVRDMIITYEFVVFKLLSYCFEETIGFDLKVSFVRRSVSRLIKPGDLTKGYSVPRGFPLG